MIGYEEQLEKMSEKFKQLGETESYPFPVENLQKRFRIGFQYEDFGLI